MMAHEFLARRVLQCLKYHSDPEGFTGELPVPVRDKYETSDWIKEAFEYFKEFVQILDEQPFDNSSGPVPPESLFALTGVHQILRLLSMLETDAIRDKCMQQLELIKVTSTVLKEEVSK